MTEADWLKAKDPDAMLRLVGPRFSARQWQLLASALVRRTWELLPVGPPRDTVEWVEARAGESLPTTTADWLADLETAADRASTAARTAERLVVLAADPDADPDRFRAIDARRTNPTAPLFQAACRYAQDAIRLAGEAAGQAVELVALLATTPPGPLQAELVGERVRAVLAVRANASSHTSSALKLKLFGDEMADRANGRKVGHHFATASELVRREDEFLGYRHNSLATAKAKAVRKALGKILHDLVGNPFHFANVQPEWRSDAVIGLAHGIDDDRAYDRLPILADALLEADCDDEAILRHCRGTEPHNADPLHGRGCWVIDRILDREPEFFSLPPIASANASPTRRTRPRPDRTLETSRLAVGR